MFTMYCINLLGAICTEFKFKKIVSRYKQRLAYVAIYSLIRYECTVQVYCTISMNVQLPQLPVILRSVERYGHAAGVAALSTVAFWRPQIRTPPSNESANTRKTYRPRRQMRHMLPVEQDKLHCNGDNGNVNILQWA